MHVFRDFENVSQITKPFVTIGSFDGVHVGHKEILYQLCRMARENGGQSVVITFSDHPRNILNNNEFHSVKLINSLDEKIELLERIGVDNLIIVTFTHEFSQIPYRDFVSRFLVDKLHINTLMVGYNHHLGHQKEGDAGSLAAMSRELGFNLLQMSSQDVDGAKVSSTIIRNEISQGKLAKAAKLLGYNYFITAEVDTQNSVTLCDSTKILPHPGVYRIKVALGKTLETVDQKQCATLIITPIGKIQLSGINIKNISNIRIFFAE